MTSKQTTHGCRDAKRHREALEARAFTGRPGVVGWERKPLGSFTSSVVSWEITNPSFENIDSSAFASKEQRDRHLLGGFHGKVRVQQTPFRAFPVRRLQRQKTPCPKTLQKAFVVGKANSLNNDIFFRVGLCNPESLFFFSAHWVLPLRGFVHLEKKWLLIGPTLPHCQTITMQ